MDKFIAGFIAGIAVAATIGLFFVIPDVAGNYRAIGRNDGHILARWEIADRIDQAFGTDLLPEERGEILYSVKTTDVVVINRNGVKTLRTRR